MTCVLLSVADSVEAGEAARAVEHIGDVFRRADSADRNLCRYGVYTVRAQRIDLIERLRCSNDSWGDGIGGDSIGGELNRQRRYESAEPAFRGRVVRVLRPRRYRPRDRRSRE